MIVKCQTEGCDWSGDIDDLSPNDIEIYDDRTIAYFCPVCRMQLDVRNDDFSPDGEDW